MTREEIWAMEPGELMDKNVGLALGYKPLNPVGYIDPKGDLYIGTPPFSTEFWAAWELVEKMIEKGWAFKLAYYGGDWHVCFGRKPSFIWDAMATGPTPMLAICRAVLICHLLEEEGEHESATSSAG